MLLILFAIILLILLITIPIIWKLIIFMITFMLTAPFKLAAIGMNGRITNQRIDPFWAHAANDSTAIWVKGTDGRFFRYGLNLSDEAENHQIEEFNEFYRNHMSG
jgi:hypothetical protein